MLPTQQWVEDYRLLSHRRTAVRLWNILSDARTKSSHIIFPMLKERAPQEFFDENEAYRFIAQNNGKCVIKWPWSSSGRGVVFTPGMEEALIRRRLSDAINSQGSAIVEPLWNRSLDFATEWKLSDGKVSFLGLSRFITPGSSGIYRGNIVASFPSHLQSIEAHLLPHQIGAALSLIPPAMTELLSPLAATSKTPLLFGIDMLADTAGHLNPCVEINLRMTMGHVALELYSLLREEFIFNPGKSCVKLQ